MTEDGLDTGALRQAFGAFVTGVTVVTTLGPDGPVGFTANSFTSVSLVPPLVLVCPAHSASSYGVFCAAGTFAVNILGAEQEPLARLFATRGADRFGATPWTPGQHGAPLLAGCLAAFDCTVESRWPAGDHDILLGRVVAFARRPGPALCYAAGAFAALG